MHGGLIEEPHARPEVENTHRHEKTIPDFGPKSDLGLKSCFEPNRIRGQHHHSRRIRNRAPQSLRPCTPAPGPWVWGWCGPHPVSMQSMQTGTATGFATAALGMPLPITTSRRRKTRTSRRGLLVQVEPHVHSHPGPPPRMKGSSDRPSSCLQWKQKRAWAAERLRPWGCTFRRPLGRPPAPFPLGLLRQGDFSGHPKRRSTYRPPLIPTGIQLTPNRPRRTPNSHPWIGGPYSRVPKYRFHCGSPP